MLAAGASIALAAVLVLLAVVDATTIAAVSAALHGIFLGAFAALRFGERGARRVRLPERQGGDQSKR